MTPNNIPEKKPEDMICPGWRTCEIHTTEKPGPHHSPHALNAGCDQTCFFASGDCIQIPETFQDKGGEKMTTIVAIPSKKLILTEEQRADLKEILSERSSGELKQMNEIIKEILYARTKTKSE